MWLCVKGTPHNLVLKKFPFLPLDCHYVLSLSSENVVQTVEVKIESMNPEIAEVTPASLEEHSIWSHPIEICGISGGLTTINASIRISDRYRNRFHNRLGIQSDLLSTRNSLLQIPCWRSMYDSVSTRDQITFPSDDSWLFGVGLHHIVVRFSLPSNLFKLQT